MRASELLGIHHVTAIAGDPQENVDFYVGRLGLRLVKKSVNQDDPSTYHLFYADGAGNPGTDLTFFPWPRAPRGRPGAGQAVSVAFAVPASSLSYWSTRLRDSGMPLSGPHARFDEEVVALSDPHGLALELVASAEAEHRQPWAAWEDGPVPPEHAIRGIHAVTLQESALEPTSAFLTGALGFRPLCEGEGRVRYGVRAGGSGALLDLLVRPDEPRGRIAVGTVHHVAWRTPNAEKQERWLEEIRALGVPHSPLIDRFWFRSLYFREPGAVLFEIATDGPGFSIDERAEDLGRRLILPPWLEPDRQQIEAGLPPITLPETDRRAAANRAAREV
jgi:glyoxalase family protein